MYNVSTRLQLINKNLINITLQQFEFESLKLTLEPVKGADNEGELSMEDANFITIWIWALTPTLEPANVGEVLP